MIRPHIGPKLTQGSIFSCAQAEDYEHCFVHGLVITARCDISHDKAAVFNYLPVVRFDDWLHRDLLSIMVARCEADVRQQFKDTLKAVGLSERITLTHTPQEILGSLFSDQSKSAQRKAHEHVRRLELIEHAKKSKPVDIAIVKLAAEFEKIKDRIVRETVHQQLSGYYFLPQIEPNEQQVGYVVLMREVRHISRELATRIAYGIDKAQYAEMQACKITPADELSMGLDDFSYCLGRLDSPVIEHLMQSFSLLFGRIGLPDPDADIVAQIWKSQPSIKGNEE
ncbi:hypothetical protein [Myxococcus xanthus]|uniref:hypothetical protein n=1 Tax=Myxococcus xanthus TaxID=34 RepID=UPI00112684FD|nr:hypothetical protein [Myxococcus xanthus]